MAGLGGQPSPVGSGVGFPLKNDSISAFTGSEGSIGNSGEGGVQWFWCKGAQLAHHMVPAKGGQKPWAEGQACELKSSNVGQQHKSPPVLFLLGHRCSMKLCWAPLIGLQQLDNKRLILHHSMEHWPSWAASPGHMCPPHGCHTAVPYA